MKKISNPKGAGRKPIDESVKAKNRSVKFTDAEWEELQIKAKAEGISRAEYINRQTDPQRRPEGYGGFAGQRPGAVAPNLPAGLQRPKVSIQGRRD